MKVKLPLRSKETQEKVRAIRNVTRGKFFITEFIERTDGTLRRMVCRTGVKKYIKGVGMSYDPNEYDLMVVWDIQKKDYRMINLSAIQLFQCGNVIWKNKKRGSK